MQMAWARTVKDQELPWINVNDGLGADSGAIRLYNVQSLPSMVLIAGETVKSDIVSASGLRKELDRIL